MKSLIIFDFDGVVADSELPANELLAEMLTEIGMPTSLDDALRLYMGKRWTDCEIAIEARHGAKLPPSLWNDFQSRIYQKFEASLAPVDGVGAFIDRFAGVARCIASSSNLDWIDRSLRRIGLAQRFEHRFSGAGMERGKPHPDIYLLAADTLGRRPADCVVIEDSVTGVTAGVAAGMLTIGLCAGGHIRDGHAERLAAAGADHVVGDYEALAALVGPLLDA